MSLPGRAAPPCLDHTSTSAEEQVPPLTRAEKAIRAAKIAAAAVVVAVGAWLTMHYLGLSKQQKLLDSALRYADQADGGKAGLAYPAAAEVYREAGEFYLRRDDPERANDYFQKCRGKLNDSPHTSEHDAALIDLARTQIDLGGSPEQVAKEKRLAWSAAEIEIQKTVQAVRTPEARGEAIRQLSQELIRKNQAEAAKILAQLPPDEVSEALGLVGLELLRSGDRQAAEAVLEEGVQRRPQSAEALPAADAPPKEPPGPAPAPPPGAPGGRPHAGRSPAPGSARESAYPVSVVALGLALDKGKQVNALRPKKESPQTDQVGWTIGRAEGLARQGKLGAARSLVGTLATKPERLRGLVAVADAVLDSKSSDTADLEQAFGLISKDMKANRELSGWVLLRLVSLADRAGLAEKVKPLTSAIADADLRGRAQLSLLRTRLEAANDKVEEGLADSVDNQTAAHNLCVQPSPATTRASPAPATP